ncbi:MAG: Arc family DNA-binding protein [Verrucomicrobia bacterium]|jgi:hypothetical protein|nr:Arc family DNA-binding protein [Verrucomicrobiota bacterium]
MAKRKAFLLRMNPKLWDELEAWAQEDMRSVNGQMEFLLKQAVNKRKNQQSKHEAKGEF